MPRLPSPITALFLAAGMAALATAAATSVQAQGAPPGLPGAKFADVRIACNVNGAGRGHCTFRNVSRYPVRTCYVIRVVRRRDRTEMGRKRLCPGRLGPRAVRRLPVLLYAMQICALHARMDRRTLHQTCRLAYARAGGATRPPARRTPGKSHPIDPGADPGIGPKLPPPKKLPAPR